MTGLDYVIVGAFLTVMALAGLLISRLIKDSDDIFVAGRELTPFILCATITSTNLSMFHFIGMGGTAYQSGASILWQNWTGDIALVLSGLFVVPMLRRLRVRSVPEFLEVRYGRGLRTVVGAFWGVRLCIYLGILLYIASTAAIVITGQADTVANYTKWLVAFSAVSLLYSVVGGAWAVAIMDSVQFCVMLAGALIILPVVTHAAGGLPAVIEFLKSTGHATQVQMVPATGDFNWLFILAILMLGFKWATVDQAILQRAFGVRTPRMAAKGMVLSAVVTTPLAAFWVLPGLAAARLHPGFTNPDNAIPWVLAHTIPAAGRGILGIVLCGLIAAQISAITADVNSVATLFASDVYRSLRRVWHHEPTQKELLVAVRLGSLLCGGMMLAAAYFMRGYGAGAVKANLAVVGLLDMPLFVVTIVYGMFWKRANWQGATAGFIGGGLIGVAARWLMLRAGMDAGVVRNSIPFISTAAALVVTPLVSLMGRGGDVEKTDRVEDAFTATGGEGKDDFHLMPVSAQGKIGVGLVVSGVVAFLAGVFSSPLGFAHSGVVAVGGMLVVFLGGMVRVYSE